MNEGNESKLYLLSHRQARHVRDWQMEKSGVAVFGVGRFNILTV